MSYDDRNGMRKAGSGSTMTMIALAAIVVISAVLHKNSQSKP
jgi:hypothetical protein